MGGTRTWKRSPDAVFTPQQLSSIKVVTDDGAKWITECVNECTPDCERFVDPFHVVEWAMKALDEVRREVRREAYSEAVQLANEHPRGKGRPKADNAEAAIVKDAKEKAEEIKNSAYALGKAPEHLTKNQQAKVAMIAGNNKRFYRAYRMKEMLRLLLKLKDVDEATTELKRWLWWASHSRIKAFKEMYLKVKRIIRKAYSFRNIQNMLDMV